MSRGAGILFIARDTGRVLLALRSAYVSEPNSWAPPGGKVEPGETPELAARRETREEIGYSYRGKLTPVFVFRSDGFRFSNFVGIVPHEFEPVLNEESDDARWFPPTRLPKNLHFGMKAMMGKLLGQNPYRLNPYRSLRMVQPNRRLGKWMWHWRLNDSVGVVSESFIAGHPVPLETARDAQSIIHRLITRAIGFLERSELEWMDKKLGKLIAEAEAGR